MHGDAREEHGDWKKDKEDTLSYGKTPDGKGKDHTS
jgi:hypothetical protein